MKALQDMEYPGRFIILGRDSTGNKNVAIYGITGRSPSSKARRLIPTGNGKNVTFGVEVTDNEQIKKGNLDLLVYDGIVKQGNSIITGNGKQTDLISKFINKLTDPQTILLQAFSNPYIVNNIDLATYEPDEPHYTPRISGIIKGEDMGLNILSNKNKKKDESPTKAYYLYKLKPGEGKLISTYSGKNESPLPSFHSEPISVELKGSLENITEDIWNSINPDVKVAIGCLSSDIKNENVAEAKYRYIN